MFYTERDFTMTERIADWWSGGELTRAEKERQRDEARQSWHNQQCAFALNYGLFYALQGQEALDFFLSSFPEDVQEYARKYLIKPRTYSDQAGKE